MRSIDNLARRAIAGMSAVLALLLAACGGGTERVTPYEPVRYIAFGDEMSVLKQPDGRKYTVNALNSDGSINCGAGGTTLWTQSISNQFSFEFEECNPSGRTAAAYTYAAPGAKAADFVTQLAEARIRFGRFSCNDLMSVLIGANDVIDLFETVYLADPTSDTANRITNELRARGERLGKEITALTDNDGPSIIVSTIPLVNLMPYAQQQNAARPGINVFNVLNTFSTEFNTALRINIPNDGSRWGLVELDALLQAGVNSPGSYGLSNVTQAACDPATWNTADCTTATLVTTDNPNNWLWASNKWMGWQAHNRLGGFARNRATGNPFGCE